MLRQYEHWSVLTCCIGIVPILALYRLEGINFGPMAETKEQNIKSNQ